MTRLNIMLLLAVLVSALYLVHVQYQSRRLFTELDRANAEAHRLDVELDRLQVERRGQATPSRVESIAKAQLQMRMPTPAITDYVVPADAASAPARIEIPATTSAREAAGRVQ